MSASEGFDFEFSSAAACMICPGWQKPHCATSSSSHACCTGCRPPLGARPSIVVTAFHHIGRSECAYLHRTAVHVAGTRAADTDAASVLRPRYAEQVAQHPEQGHVGRRVDLDVLA